MSKSLARDLRTAAIALTVSALVLGTPAIAAVVNHALFADNADKVDKKHAVGSGATVTKRKGKLVATSPTTGRLPNNIIAKVADADKLDGADSTAFLKNQGQTIVPLSGPWFPSEGGVTITTDALDTTITRGSAGTGGAIAKPTMPVQMFGKPMSLVGAKICYDAGVASVNINNVMVAVVTEANAYFPDIVYAVNDNTTRDGTACMSFLGTPQPMTPDSYPMITVRGVWTGAGNLYLTHSSLIFAPS